MEQNKTQVQLAEEAGLNRWTVGQIEKGKSITLLSLIQILRVLGLLHTLKSFAYEKPISPIAYAKLQGKERKRARPKKPLYKREDEDGGIYW